MNIHSQLHWFFLCLLVSATLCPSLSLPLTQASSIQSVKGEEVDSFSLYEIARKKKVLEKRTGEILDSMGIGEDERRRKYIQAVLATTYGPEAAGLPSGRDEVHSHSRNIFENPSFQNELNEVFFRLSRGARYFERMSVGSRLESVVIVTHQSKKLSRITADFLRTHPDLQDSPVLLLASPTFPIYSSDLLELDSLVRFSGMGEMEGLSLVAPELHFLGGSFELCLAESIEYAIEDYMDQDVAYALNIQIHSELTYGGDPVDDYVMWAAENLHPGKTYFEAKKLFDRFLKQAGNLLIEFEVSARGAIDDQGRPMLVFVLESRSSKRMVFVNLLTSKILNL